MILSYQEIIDREIVTGERASGQRKLTTYDATVGHIFCEGEELDVESYVLKPRGIVWVSSNEKFSIPDDITAIATLRTTWTHNGILALNVGIVDPGWQGPLATAVVNFSKNSFTITKGSPFFRLIFMEHGPTNAPIVSKNHTVYTGEITARTNQFSNTFLSFDTLVPDVSREILKLPTWAFWTGIAALIIAIIAIFAPLAVSVHTESSSRKGELLFLEKRLQKLCNTSKETKRACEI